MVRLPHPSSQRVGDIVERQAVAADQQIDARSQRSFDGQIEGAFFGNEVDAARGEIFHTPKITKPSVLGYRPPDDFKTDLWINPVGDAYLGVGEDSVGNMWGFIGVGFWDRNC